MVIRNAAVLLCVLASVALGARPGSTSAPATSGPVAPQPYKDFARPLAVATLPFDWADTAHETTVPVRLYYPKTLAEQKLPLPVIVFSHGLGGSRDGYRMWAEHWASYGYIVVLPSHEGSDTAAVARALQSPTAAAARDEVINVRSALRRVQDVSFVIDQMEKANAGMLKDAALAGFKGKVDVQHIGMAGHSFGAQTTLMVAGETETVVRPMNFGDKRVTAAIAMSPQPAMRSDQKTAFGSIRIPVFHMTGTLDDAPVNITPTKAADRRIPYDNTSAAEAYLVNFAGGTHMTFSGRMANPPAQEVMFQKLIKESTTAFWDAYLKNDEKAKSWLREDFARVMGKTGTFEMKSPK